MPPTELPPLLTRARAALLVGALVLLAPLFLGVDRWVSRAMTNLDPQLVDFFQAITFLGRSPGYLLASAGIAICGFVGARHPAQPPDRRARARATAEAAAFVFATIAVAGIATNLIKVVVGRLRPSLLLDAGQYGFAPFSFDSTMRSFPSGHATTAFALALALAALWPRRRWWLIGAACLIAASRVAINAHYLGDVVGGALVAAATMLVVRHWFAGRGAAFRVEAGGYARRTAAEP